MLSRNRPRKVSVALNRQRKLLASFFLFFTAIILSFLFAKGKLPQLSAYWKNLLFSVMQSYNNNSAGALSLSDLAFDGQFLKFL